MSLSEKQIAQHQAMAVTDAERPWLEGFDLKRHAELVDAVREAGYSNGVALAVASWVAEKSQGRPDLTTGKTRAGYRAVLEDIGPPPQHQTPRRLIASGEAA